jgi:DNA modification methylase
MQIRANEIKLVSLDEIKLNPRNRNKHSKEQITRLAEIITYQGFRNPLIISNRSGHCVAGEGRYLAAKKLKLKTVPVIFQDFDSDEQEIAAGVSDNAIGLWSELDLSGINTDIPDLGPDFNIDLLGIKNFEIDVADKEGLTDPDEVPDAPKEPISVLGDLYELGPHRVLCGDSTSIDAVERLMNGEKADLWLTDAPYGVSYADKNEFLNALGKPNRITKRIENDHMSIEEMSEFWFQIALTAHLVCSDKCAYYWFACQGGDQMMMMMSIGKAGWKVRHELIWVKNNHVLGRCDYNYKHEPILYGWKSDGTHKFYGGFQTSVLEFPKPQSNKLHPTMKPIELLERLIDNSSQVGEMVLDSFGGSGSTLMACEKKNRKARLCEIDPHYIDVIVTRWCKFTGQTKIKRNGVEIDWVIIT